ncbi:uberolysin/carnocyclin family circular bacteriocin [Bacillus sp. V3B]|uniref:uberolysin/carnocyclin family circular bacteriocin n=1 Tax=Bacillus sp. V3B TaxID=2804915 RepID=UPI00210A1FD4|nr:uberolysin/carnocyclin family circular bacteriocin [Bacillus sp. V3B]MCQ6277183.1 uberolysin/carnocyclin family circular bacteriocin [Bacillus sp. V3B]
MEVTTNRKPKIFVAFGMVLLSILVMFGTTGSPVKYNHTVASNANIQTIEQSSLEVNLAKIINKYSKKTTWNQAQQKAKKIVNLVMTGSDIAAAVSLVLGFFSFGTITAIAWVARMSLKYYIKRKGRRAAVTW